jgi:hypothetical protein
MTQHFRGDVPTLNTPADSNTSPTRSERGSAPPSKIITEPGQKHVGVGGWGGGSRQYGNVLIREGGSTLFFRIVKISSVVPKNFSEFLRLWRVYSKSQSPKLDKLIFFLTAEGSVLV